jgi:APA family basic amino acid/polyamine antiporter
MPAEFGLATATFVVITSMVGVGVLTTSGMIVARVGSNQLMLVLWVIGGLMALSGALTLAELSAALPRAGGEYVILYEAYGPLAAFLWGWVTIFIGFAAPISASAWASASYLLAPLGLRGATSQYTQLAVASLAILAFSVVHSSGRSRTARVQGTITVLNLALLGLFLVAGLAAGRHHGVNLDDRPPMNVSIATEMTFALVLISYAYLGWNAASYLAGEVREPERRLPQALVLGTGGVVLLYLGLNLVYALALSSGDIRAIVERDGSDALKPIAELAATRLFGAWLSGPLSVAMGLILLSSVSAYVLSGPRVAYAMACAGHFPAFAGRLSFRSQTPAIATAVIAALALGLLWTGTFESIVIYASVGMAIFSLLTISSVYVLRRRRPDLKRPFRTPGYPFVPAVYLVGSSLLTAAAFSQSPIISCYSLASILAGVPVYYAWTWFKRPAAAEE